MDGHVNDYSVARDVSIVRTMACVMCGTVLYSVLCYLSMFRLEELGMVHFKRLVDSQHTGKMHKVFSTLLNDRWRPRLLHKTNLCSS